MKRFEFRLESVRRWREEQAAQERQKLERLEAERWNLAAALESLVRQHAAGTAKLLASDSIDGGALAALDQWRRHGAGQCRRLENEIVEFGAAITAQRQQCVEARRHVELLNRLREKRLTAWIAAAAKEQEQLAAELFLARRER